MVSLFDAFLEDLHINNAKTTYEWYKHFLFSFGKRHKKLLISELAPFHVTEWANREFGSDSASTRHGAIRAAQRALNWAVDQNLIPSRPIARIKKPAPTRRDTIVPPKLFGEILGKEPEPCWQDFLHFMRETGPRNQNP